MTDNFKARCSAIVVAIILFSCQEPQPKYCNFKIEQPYFLIQFTDSSYGILFASINNWYKCDPNSGHDFSFIRDNALHFNDSCEAKQSLVKFLQEQGKLEYKVVNQ